MSAPRADRPSTDCDGCSTPTNAGYLCKDCTAVLRDNLQKALWLWDELDVTRTRQARIGKDRVGGRSSDTPLPFHEGASRAADMLHNTVHLWARVLDHVSDTHIEPSRVKPTVEWMIRNVHTVARLENAGQVYRAFAGVVDHCLVTIDHPIDKLFAGRCTLDKDDEEGCDADLYALPEDHEVVCWLCETPHDLQQRRNLMLALALNWVDSAAKLEKFFLIVGHKIPAGTIRYWASDDKLESYSEPGEQAVYMVRDVLKLKYGVDAVGDYAEAC